MALSKDIIDSTLKSPQGENAYKVAETLHDAGYEAWWVGGCVRDMALGNIPEDIDIATDAKPEDVKKLFPKNDPTGEKFGSVIVFLEGQDFEVTTFREDDTASDGRHPESVSFGTRENDAKRRDFTVNALYWNPISGELYDPFEGEGDLSERLIRFIGDPETRIKHDALRMLRAVRFRALIDGQYHPDTFKALHKNAKDIEVLSGTRRLAELEKMLLGPHPERALEDLWETDILEYLLPELHACKGVAQPADYHHEGDVWEHTMQCAKNFRDEDGIDTRLAAIFHDIGKATTFSRKERIRFDEHASASGDLVKAALDRLQCSGKRRDKIDWLVSHHMMMASFFQMDDESKSKWYYHPWFPELIQLFWLDIAGTTPSNYDLYDKILDDYHAFLDSHPLPPKTLLTGDEVMEILATGSGEHVGRILKELYGKQITGEVTSKKDAKEFVESQKGE